MRTEAGRTGRLGENIRVHADADRRADERHADENADRTRRLGEDIRVYADERHADGTGRLGEDIRRSPRRHHRSPSSPMSPGACTMGAWVV